MFIQRAQVYWITWALIILGAWSTGIASVSDAFFRGAFAAFLSAAALPLYRQLGPRKAAFLGLVVGITWQLGFHHLWGRMIWGEAEFALASARLVLDLSVAAAAFAGGALAGALLTSGRTLGKTLVLSTLLALLMTGLPYGLVSSLDRDRAGPIKLIWLGAAQTHADGGPIRPKGADIPVLTEADTLLLRKRFLTVTVGNEIGVVDTEGQRRWAVWRGQLQAEGHEALAARTVVIINRLPADVAVPAVSVALSDDPKGYTGIELAVLDGQPTATRFGDEASTSPEVELSIGQNAEGIYLRAVRHLPFTGNYAEGPRDQVVSRPRDLPTPPVEVAPTGERALPPSLRGPSATPVVPR